MRGEGEGGNKGNEKGYNSTGANGPWRPFSIVIAHRGKTKELLCFERSLSMGGEGSWGSRRILWIWLSEYRWVRGGRGRGEEG